jgi:Uma2 family endonuclease
MSVEQKLLTAEDLWKMPEVPGKRYELVNGELVEMPGAGGQHMAMVVFIFEVLKAFVVEHDLGIVYPDGLAYIIARNPDRVRIPDVSFVTHERVPEGGPPEGFWPVAPNLAVEVVSPSDSAGDLHYKVRDYLTSGVELVWVVWPKSQVVSVHTPGAAVRELELHDELVGGDLLPGFRVRVSELFDGGR